MGANEQYLNEIIEALYEANFYELNDNNFYDQIINPFKNKYKKSFKYDSGATKGVLIFKDFNFVIKIPFSLSGDEYELCGAECDEGWNYCKVEEQIYNFAIDNHMEEHFAATKQIAIINNYPIYMQEYAIMYCSAESSSSQNHTQQDYEKIEQISNEKGYDIDCHWLSDVYNYFGEKQFYNLMQYIEDTEIRDLHGANIGYIGMRPVLVDYSSYND